jgi:hypothetical protein
MISKSMSDLEINRHVRRFFVRHNINLGWISIRSCRGSVMITGNLVLLPGSPGALNSTLLTTLFREMRQTAGIQRITTEFTNWEHDGSMKAWFLKGSSTGSKLDIPIRNTASFDLSD